MPTVDPTPDAPGFDDSTLYATAQELKDILSPTTDQNDGQSAALLPDEQLEECIQRSQDKIDARLGSRYVVPFSPVPNVVHDLVLELAAWDATLIYRRSDVVTENDPSRLRGVAAEAELAEYATGPSVIPGAISTAVAPSQDLSDPMVVNPDWHQCDLTDPGMLAPIPLVNYPGYGGW